MHPLPRRPLSEDEYLLIERGATFKSEFLDGEMYAMAGAGQQHARIIANISGLLHAQFRGRGCDVFTNDMRVRVAESGLYTYPDIVAFCGEARMLDAHNDTLLNPQLIVEVLSPSTANYDLGEKGIRYRQLESLMDYVLVEQRQMLVQHWSRRDGQLWTMLEYNLPSDCLRIEALAVALPLAGIYERVTFPPQVVPSPG